MSSIVLANEYTRFALPERSLTTTPQFSSRLVVPKKKQAPGLERQVKGHVRVRRDMTAEKLMPLPVNEFDRADEMLAGMREGTDRLLEKFRYPNQKSLTDEDKRYTNGMWSQELVKRVLKCNRNLFVEDSKNFPGCAGFYKMVGKMKTAAGYPNASFRHGFMPEATIVKENAERLATEFVYGWRQVLIRLRRSKDLTEVQFKKLWGVVDYGDERARAWSLDLGEFRA
jgi:hypothetical protein